MIIVTTGLEEGSKNRNQKGYRIPTPTEHIKGLAAMVLKHFT